MEELVVKVSDWTKFPGPKFISNGPFSGEEYRYTILDPIISEAREKGYNLKKL